MANDIWVNARFLTQKKTGVQQYAIEICRELIKINPKIKLIAPKNILNETLAKSLKVNITGNRKGTMWEQIDLPRFLKNKKNPLLLNLCNTAPLNYKNNVITIHDLAFIENPAWFSFSFNKWYQFLIPSITKKATHIFSVSHFSKTEIINKLNIKESNISLSYNGLSKKLKAFKDNNSSPPEKEKIILAVGSLNPRKNIIELINAFNLLQLNDYQLIIVGASDKIFKSESYKNTNSNIKFSGYIEDDELFKLYQSAEILVYPSLYEGFGIPILEALYFNCKVVAIDLPIYREVYANFDITFSKGHEKRALAEAIVQSLKKDMVKNVNHLFEKYSYQKEAKKINDIISNFTSK